MRPLIGVLPLWSENEKSWHKMSLYCKAVEDAGAMAMPFPVVRTKEEARRMVRLCDGILFTGGQDVDPEVYGKQPYNETVQPCRERDTMELLVLEAAEAQEKVILGICRGIQFLTAAQGGDLYQHLPEEHPGQVSHNQTVPSDQPCHKVELIPGTPLQALLGCDRIPVNSFHHQAVREPAPGFQVMGVSEDGIIESVYRPDRKFCWAVQWHPERTYHVQETDARIFRAFVEAAAGEENPDLILETENLLLRPFRTGDEEDLLDYLKAPAMHCFFDMKVSSLSQAEQEVRQRSKQSLYFAVEEKKSGKVIGEIWGHAEKTAPGGIADTYSPCWMLHPDYCGKGYGYEAAKAFIGELFSHQGARRVYMYTEDNNIPCQKLCEKLGARKEGTFQSFVSFVKDAQGEPIYENTLQYAILKSEWEAN